jgi:hypothetical protein
VDVVGAIEITRVSPGVEVSELISHPVIIPEAKTDPKIALFALETDEPNPEFVINLILSPNLN